MKLKNQNCHTSTIEKVVSKILKTDFYFIIMTAHFLKNGLLKQFILKA